MEWIDLLYLFIHHIAVIELRGREDLFSSGYLSRHSRRGNVFPFQKSSFSILSYANPFATQNDQIHLILQVFTGF